MTAISDSTLDVSTIPSETTTLSTNLSTNENTTDQSVLNVEVDGEVAINLNEDASGLSISSENNSNTINDQQYFNSETTTSAPELITTILSELIPTQTDNIINGKQLISDSMIIGSESTKNSSAEAKSDPTEAPLIISPEPVTQIISNQSQSVDQNQVINHSNKLVLDDLNETTSKSLPETTTASEILVNVSSPQENSTVNSLLTTTRADQTIDRSEDMSTESPTKDQSEAKQIQNGTYESVGLLLRGIIDAIDQQLQRTTPTEQQTQTNSSEMTETNQNSNINQTSKQSQFRSEEKRGPALSSSFFITDNNEKPYKLDSEGVEIITAKTAFYDLEEHPTGIRDSILVNLSPSSLKVGTSPILKNSPNANRDKNFNVLAQNNRATINGKPGHLEAHSPVHSSAHSPIGSVHTGHLAHSFPQIIKPFNDWRAVGSNVDQTRRTYSESPLGSKPIDSLYYTSNIRRNDDFDDSLERNSSEVDKRPRLEFDGHNDANRMKVIPFKVNDAFSGMTPKKKNGSFLIRVSSPNKNSLPQESTPKSVQLSIASIITSYNYSNVCQYVNMNSIVLLQQLGIPERSDDP